MQLTIQIKYKQKMALMVGLQEKNDKYMNKKIDYYK